MGGIIEISEEKKKRKNNIRFISLLRETLFMLRKEITEDNDSIKIGNSFTVEVLQCNILMKY